MRNRIIAGAVAAALVATAAIAADTEIKVKKLGNAEIRWNPVTYRDELMGQLSPGLTWRLGKDGATRLKLQKMALVTTGSGVLLPGDQTLNLRFWAWDNWELVVFEENNWKWSEESTEFGIFEATVGPLQYEKDHAKQLALELKQTTRGQPTTIERAAVTGSDADLAELFSVPDDVEYEPDLRKQWEALPLVELVMRFGPNQGIVGFDPVAVRELKTSFARKDAKKRKVTLLGLDLPAPRVRAAYLEEHEGEIPVAVMTESGAGGEHLALHLSGSETPLLWPRTRNGTDIGEPIEGTRTEAQLKKAPSTVFCEIEGSVLRVTVAPWVYTFDLATR